MRHPPPTAPELGEHDGLAYALFLPEEEPDAGRRDLPRRRLGQGEPLRLRARLPRRRAWRRSPTTRAATGAPTASFGPSAFDDALAMADLLRAHAPRIALRGSSMGGFQAIHAAAQSRPARRRRGGDLPGARGPAAARPALGQELATSDATARRPSRGSSRSTSTPRPPRLGPDTALLLMHARGDEQVPYTSARSCTTRPREPEAPADHARRPPPLAAARRGDAGGLAQLHPAVLRIILVRLAPVPSPLDLADLPFLREALFELILLAVPGGVLGAWIVLRRLAFFTHAVGSATFPGLVVADAVRHQPAARRARRRARLRRRRPARRAGRAASTARARRCCSWPRSPSA